jgi:sensor histidine kinase YesM
MGKTGLHILLSAGLMVTLGMGYYYYRGVPRETAAWITVLSFLVLLGCIFTGRALCSRWFSQSRPLSYLLYVVPCLAIILVLWYYLVRFGLSLPDLGFVELAVAYSPVFILGLVAGFLIKLIRNYMQKQLNEARAQAVQKENELHQLHSQLSPHFLFNTLNNMYGIAIADHKRIPKLLLKLSDLLRYSLYETGQPFVPLKDELTYIRNYIEFEKMRISDRLILTDTIEEPADTAVRIAPMVLIVFIENAFKHSKNTLDEKVMIDISLKVSAGNILFNISNSYNAENKHNGLVNGHSGLGLTNAAKRLELLYGKNHQLKTFADYEKYVVELELKTM